MKFHCADDVVIEAPASEVEEGKRVWRLSPWLTIDKVKVESIEDDADRHLVADRDPREKVSDDELGDHFDAEHGLGE